MPEYEFYPEDSKFYTWNPKKWYQKVKNKIIWWLYDIDLWMYRHSPIYIDLNLLSIFKEWWECRDIYRFPKITINCGKEWVDYRIMPPTWLPAEIFKRTFNWISIYKQNLGWKHKWDYVSWESEPYINITFFNCFGINIRLDSPYVDNKGYPDNHLYWESMVEYLYLYKKDFIKTYNEWGWRRWLCSEDKKIELEYNTWNWNIINRKGIDKYYKLVKDKEIKINIRETVDKQEVTLKV